MNDDHIIPDLNVVYLLLSASNVLFFYPPDWVNITGNILGHVDHPNA